MRPRFGLMFRDPKESVNEKTHPLVSLRTIGDVRNGSCQQPCKQSVRGSHGVILPRLTMITLLDRQ
jgi:hypothetical protein